MVLLIRLYWTLVISTTELNVGQNAFLEQTSESILLRKSSNTTKRAKQSYFINLESAFLFLFSYRLFIGSQSRSYTLWVYSMVVTPDRDKYS